MQKDFSAIQSVKYAVREFKKMKFNESQEYIHCKAAGHSMSIYLVFKNEEWTLSTPSIEWAPAPTDTNP